MERQHSEAIGTLYAPAHPVDIGHTLGPLWRGRFDPTMRRDATGVWRTLRTPQGGATLHLVSSRAGVSATAWGPGAAWAIDGVPAMLGCEDDTEGFDPGHPLIADSLRRNPGLRLLRTRQVFEMLVAAIFEQKVTGVEARRSWHALVTKYGEPAPGPAPAGMCVFPTATAWARIPSWEWHRAGVGPERSATVIRAAAVAVAVERTLELGRGGPSVEGPLRSIRGVGVWTAAETIQRAHGDPDSPSIGDYHVSSLVGWALIGKPVDDDGMLELLEPWAGHRHRVVRLIGASGFEKPKFGPRMTIQDHRAH